MNLTKCLGCMEDYRGTPCPLCGYDPGKAEGLEYTLPPQTILAGKYLVGRMLGAWAPVMFFVVAGFSHSIADMTYCALALFAKNVYAADPSALTWGRYFLGNMLPVTLGNIVGGLLVGGTAWYCYLRKKG